MSAKHGKGRRVLIVDLDRAVADTTAMIFSLEGYEVRRVYTAEVALPLVQQWCPDLAILEIILMDMNGLDCAIRVQAACPDCRIVLFSGEVADELKDAARARGYTFFDKPVHPSLLLGEAERLLDISSAPKPD